MDLTANFYSRPSNEFRGGSYPIFTGSRRQRGGGIFGTLAKFFAPIAKNIGKSLLANTVSFAKDVVVDTAKGNNFKDSLKKHGKRNAIRFGKAAAQQGLSRISEMIGTGSRRTPRRLQRRKVTRKRKSKRPVRKTASRKTVSRKTVSRKRRARPKSTQKPKAKRRRIAANF